MVGPTTTHNFFDFSYTLLVRPAAASYRFSSSRPASVPPPPHNSSCYLQSLSPPLPCGSIDIFQDNSKLQIRATVFVYQSVLRLSALVVLQIHPIKGIFLHRHPDFTVKYQFSRTRHPLYLILHTSHQPRDPHVIHLHFYLPPPHPIPGAFLLSLPHPTYHGVPAPYFASHGGPTAEEVARRGGWPARKSRRR
jgi:hypothetical protein